MNLTTLRAFFGWCLVINVAILLIWALAMLSGDWAVRLQTSIADIEEATVRAIHFQLMGQFKLLIFIFNLAPWLALRLRSGEPRT